MFLSLLDHNRIPSIWKDFERLENQFARSNRGYFHSENFPAIHLTSNEDEAVITAQIPGYSPEEIHITVADSVLTISGKKEKLVKEEGELIHREIFQEEFSRSIEMPFRINSEKVLAKTKNGILVVTLAKAEEDKPKKIEVRSE